MDLRLAVYELAAEHSLDAARTRQMEALAGLRGQPDGLAHGLPRAAAVLATALVGLGLVFWVAANWDTLGRFGRFALLQGVVLAAGLGAMRGGAGRGPLGLLALLAIGGLFAYFGQTYQTGADPWQLFALWAALGLPLCLGVRSDVAWAPWSLVAMTGISLWIHAWSGHAWRMQAGDLPVHLAGWGAALAVCGSLAPWLRRFSGAGPWSLRTALSLALSMIAFTGIAALFTSRIQPQYGAALALSAIVAAACALPRHFDIYGLSASALALDTLLIGGLARRILDRAGHGDELGRLLLLGLMAAGVLAATVSAVLKLARHRAARGEAA